MEDEYSQITGTSTFYQPDCFLCVVRSFRCAVKHLYTDNLPIYIIWFLPGRESVYRCFRYGLQTVIVDKQSCVVKIIRGVDTIKKEDLVITK